jgi:hypothetical protein
MPDLRCAMLAAAILADAVDLERVAGGQVVIALADFLLQLANFLGKKLNRTAALGADHVVVAAAVVLVLIARDAVVKGDFTGQAALGQQLERPINGGVADVRVFFLHQPMEFISGEMIPGLKKRAQDSIALPGLLQSDPLQMAVQNVLSLADHFPGNRRLVINAVLQHGRRESWDSAYHRHLESGIAVCWRTRRSRLEYNQEIQ